MRQAAEDLERRAPAAQTDGDLLDLIAQADGRSSGIRGALQDLIERIMGEDQGR